MPRPPLPSAPPGAHRHSGRCDAPGSHSAGASASHSAEPATGEHPRPGAGVPGYQLVALPNENVPNFQRRTVYCPAGKKVLGGGAEARGNDAILVGSFPTDDGTGWIGLGRQTTTDTVGISVFAICADA